MISKLLRTDVVSVRCIGSYVFVGMGYSLLVFRRSTYQLELKLDCLYPNNIHGIVEGPNTKVVIFGGRSIRLYHFSEDDDKLIFNELSDILYFNDWIISAKWIQKDTFTCLGLLFAHNNVYIYNYFDKKHNNIQCEEKCILYGGSMFQECQGDLIVFSGTVFQEILIWKINSFSNCTHNIPVLHRLTGHKGVIFSVIYDPYSKLICSTSDDRTIRLWKVLQKQESLSVNSVNWHETEIRLLKTMFGHTARVWRAIIKNEHLITIGEDSLICKWSLDGTLLEKTQAHHGAAIWSIDISEDDETIFTGGADGAVYAWPLIHDKVPTLISFPNFMEKKVPKYVCYLLSGALVVFVEGGNLLYHSKGEEIPQKNLYLEKYTTYCVMQISPCRKYIAFASREGYITIYKEIESANGMDIQQIMEERILESKIFSLQWLSSNKIIVCGADGFLEILQITESSVCVQANYTLPSSRERWLTAAIIYENFIVCGDRAGSLHVFSYDVSGELNINSKPNGPAQSFPKAHGKIGIQSFAIFETKLITTGRDGFIKFYEKSKTSEGESLDLLYSKKMPMDWVGGNIKMGSDILVLGFKEVEFIIYSVFLQRLLMRIPCGGGHRSWDCMMLNKSVSFAYLRSKQIHSFSYPLCSLQMPVVLEGFHTKEVYCIQPLVQSNEHNLFISGGEDCSLRISYIARDHSFHTFGIYDGHISSIKSIAVIKTGNTVLQNKYLAFSGGGRAQIKVWEINIKAQSNKNTLDSADVSCADLNSHMLYGKDQYRKKCPGQNKRNYVIEPETRYMDINVLSLSEISTVILIFVACADGFLRIFTYDRKANSIELKRNVHCSSRCILKLNTIRCKEKTIVLTMTTDGAVKFWDLTDVVASICETISNGQQDSDDITVPPFSTFRLHQSGINCFDFKATAENEYLLLTGGDDNLLSLLSFKINCETVGKAPTISESLTWNTSSVHSAQITGARFSGDSNFFTSGMDQRVVMHTYSRKANALSVTVNKMMYTSVPDAQGLTVCSNVKNQEVLLCMYGKGFEVILTQDNQGESIHARVCT